MGSFFRKGSKYLFFHNQEDFIMVSQPVLTAMNEQVTHEMASAYLYLQMAAYFETINLPGFASWMKAQFQEEQEHALKFYEFILDRGEKVALQAIPAPETEFTSPLDVFQRTLAHEQKVTALIHNLYQVASENNDVASQIFLQWFVTEQVEEEKNASYVVDILSKIGSSVGSLYQLDHQMGKRGG
jgi:ferritin